MCDRKIIYGISKSLAFDDLNSSEGDGLVGLT